MYIQKSIEKAIEGGWNPNMFSGADWTVGMVQAKQCDEKTFLDPLFWQSLGKSLGWKGRMNADCETSEGWLYHWHCFIDHLAEEKDAESFFKDLLTP